VPAAIFEMNPSSLTCSFRYSFKTSSQAWGQFFSEITPLEDHQYDKKEIRIINDVVYHVYSFEEKNKLLNTYVNESGVVVSGIYDYSEGFMSLALIDSSTDVTADMFTVDPSCTSESNFTEPPAELGYCTDLYFNHLYPECSLIVEGTRKINDTEPIPYTFFYFPTRGYLIGEKRADNSYQRVFRGDLNSGDIPIFTGENGACEATVGSSDDFEDFYSITFGMEQMSSITCYKESVSCLDNKQCIKYCTTTQKTECVTVLDSEPYYPVEYYVQHPKYGNVTVTYDVIKMDEDINPDLIVLDSNQFAGCPDEAYHGIENICGAYYNLPNFPCSFAATIQRTEGRGSTPSQIFFAADYTSNSAIYTVDDSTAYVLRGDLNLTASFDSDSCSEEEPDEDEMNSFVNNNFLNLLNPATRFGIYDNVTKKTINGVEYNVYSYYSSTEDENISAALYIGLTGFPEKFEYNKESESNPEYSKLEISYTFEDLNKEMFKLPAQFSGCSTSEFYSAPEISQFCKSVTLPEFNLTNCAFSVEFTVEVNDTTTQKKMYEAHSFDKEEEGFPVLVLEENDGSLKTIVRGDLGVYIRFAYDYDVPVFIGSNKCEFNVYTMREYLSFTNDYFAPFNYETFEFNSEEEVTCGSGTCKKYCKNDNECITTSDSYPLFVVKYEYAKTPNEWVNVTYGTVAEADLSAFALDENRYPGCAGHPEAYEETKVCPKKHSDSTSTSTSTSTSHGTSTSTSTSSDNKLSSASSVCASIVIVFVAIAIALF